MGRKVTYRLILIRPDGTRELVATGISEARATAMQPLLDSEQLVSKLVLEPERKTDGLPRP